MTKVEIAKKINVGFPCPSCGTIIQIIGEAKETLVSENVNIDDILHLFTSAVQKDMKVTIEGNHALLELGGKYNKSKFAKANQEVRGYGGRWIKGHFILPLAGLGEGE